MSELSHHQIKVNGISLHVVEQGTGPFVLLLHGFPELWYSWRHQIHFLANHGYRAVAPDLRGYGDSESPLSHTDYTVSHLVDDVVALLDHFAQQQVFVVAHDWGAIVGWHLCLTKPERVKAFICLSVPYFPRNPHLKPTQLFRQTFGDGLYISQFQEPGRAETAFAKYDALTVIKKFLLIMKTDNLVAPPGMEIIDYLETPPLPPWITEEELQVYAHKFHQTGFTGPLNYYRAMDLNWEILEEWHDSKIMVPTKFMTGDKNIGSDSGQTLEYIKGEIFRSLVPNLEIVIIQDGHHFFNQEKHQQVSEEIFSFLNKFSTA